MDVFYDWEYKRGGRGRNERLGVKIRALIGRFRRLGDQNGRFRRLGDRKRLPIVQNVHEAHQMTPNRAKRPRRSGQGKSERPRRQSGAALRSAVLTARVIKAAFARWASSRAGQLRNRTAFASRAARVVNETHAQPKRDASLKPYATKKNFTRKIAAST